VEFALRKNAFECHGGERGLYGFCLIQLLWIEKAEMAILLI